MATKIDTSGMTEAEKLILLNERLLDKMLAALDTPKPVPAALLVAISRVATGDVAQATIKRHLTATQKKVPNLSALQLPDFTEMDKEAAEWDAPGSANGSAPTKPQEAPQGAIPGGRYGDPEDHL
jgi:hypothetical protein